MIQGNGNILLGDTLYRLESGRLYFIPALVLHYTHPSVPENYIRSKLVFSRHLIQKVLTACESLYLLENLEQTPWSPECKTPDKTARIEHFFEEAAQIWKDQSRSTAAQTAGLLLQMLSYLSDTLAPDITAVYHADPLMNTMLTYINAHLGDDLSLDRIAHHCHISKYYISHVMRNKLHIGFNDYINSLRISNACKHLKKTDKSITEISDIVGFNTLRTFNRAFLKQMGMTPSEYRTKK